MSKSSKLIEVMFGSGENKEYYPYVSECKILGKEKVSELDSRLRLLERDKKTRQKLQRRGLRCAICDEALNPINYTTDKYTWDSRLGHYLSQHRREHPLLKELLEFHQVATPTKYIKKNESTHIMLMGSVSQGFKAVGPATITELENCLTQTEFSELSEHIEFIEISSLEDYMKGNQ